MASHVVKYTKPDRVFLFGGTPLMGKVFEWLLQRGIPVVPYTAPRQAADCGIGPPMINITEDINARLPLSLITDKSIGIGLGEAWQFGPEIRAAFGDRLVDFMTIPYPDYFGGAHITWAKLRGEQQWGSFLQLVTENTKQGEIHDGDIFSIHHYSFDERESFSFLHITDFLTDCMLGVAFPYRQKPEPASFYPRLKTSEHGWIDWRWLSDEIARFIDAFDDPYPGARTFIGDRAVTLHKPSLPDEGPRLHPYQSGLIVRCKNGRATVVAMELLDVEIRCDGVIADWIKPGMRLYTPQALLERAMTYVHEYGPNG